MNWGEVKLATLQKIDPSVTSTIPARNTKDYINSLIHAANRGLQDLATAGKYITKSIRIVQSKKTNLLPETHTIYSHTRGEEKYKAEGCSYYFEISDVGTVKIYKDDVLFDTINNNTDGTFTAYKGVVSDDPCKIEIVFSGNYPYMYKNIAIWGCAFPTDDLVWDYKEVNTYNLRNLATDFYNLSTYDVNYIGDAYLHSYNYFWQGDSELVIDSDLSGEFIVHYHAYPAMVTTATQDNYEMPLDPEVAVLLPVYIASEVLYDDDPSASVTYRNQYEAGKDKLVPSINLGNKSQFVDDSGWI